MRQQRAPDKFRRPRQHAQPQIRRQPNVRLERGFGVGASQAHIDGTGCTAR